MTRNKPVILLAAAAMVAVLLISPQSAKAIAISVTSATNNTTTSLTGGGSGDRAQANSLSVTNSGTNTGTDFVAAVATGASRYISNAAADRAIAVSGGTAKAQINSDYTVAFSVTPVFALTTYTVKIDTLLHGWLTAVDDSGIGASSGGTETVSNVTGLLNAVGNANLGLSTNASADGTSGTLDNAINASNSLTLGPFSGPTSFTVRFTWSTSASSPQNVAAGDEAAVRLGANGPLGGASADDYPGPNSRNQAADGHFLNISATVLSIPEPSSVVLAALGAVGLGLAAWRRPTA